MTRYAQATADLILDWYRAALAAVEPASAVERYLTWNGQALVVAGQLVPVPGRLVVVGVGKAAVAMVHGAERVCGEAIDGGLVITKDGHASGQPVIGLPIVEAAHPLPDERGVNATRELLELLGGLGAEDVVLALISGGGSSLLEAPRPPLTLADLATTTDLLLRAGAPIDDLNAVRTPLSLVKAGGLRRTAAPAAVVTLILSDVLGNDTTVIASGPTVAGRPNPERALALLDRYRVRDRVPQRVTEVLQRLQTERVGKGAAPPASDVVAVVGDNETALTAAAEAARASGFRTDVIWRERRGEAADLGRAWVAECRAASPERDLLLGGGEATVTVRGDGLGGRNTEFALAAALALDPSDADWVVASLATDGQDGPTGAAGAIADAGTARRARAAGIDPELALTRNDSASVFAATGGLIRPGPTGTNVNDLYFATRVDASGRSL